LVRCHHALKRCGLFEIVEMTMTITVARIKVGDTVLWRPGKSRRRTGLPIGIANCKVVKLGETASGVEAALIKLPEVLLRGSVVGSKLENDGLDLSQPVCVVVDDLEN
jgi:hypothetical protein